MASQVLSERKHHLFFRSEKESFAQGPGFFSLSDHKTILLESKRDKLHQLCQLRSITIKCLTQLKLPLLQLAENVSNCTVRKAKQE